MRSIRTSTCLLNASALLLLTSCASYNTHATGGQPQPVLTSPVISWKPAAITYPAPLSSAQLDAYANVPGAFVYSPGAGTVLQPGMQTLKATFTPADTTHYSTADTSVTLLVHSAGSKTTPQITWVPPAPIFYPQPLGPEQLSAIQSVAGTFAYSPPAGTVLSPGTQSLSTVFTPVDTTHYNTATASVTLLVNPTPPPPQCPQPNAQSVNSSAHLAVADTGNSRVLIFDAPFSTGECASAVLGQAQFYYTDSLQPISASALFEPMGMAVDAAGNLYVADHNVTGRIMQFQPPFSNDMNASLELGKPALNAPGDFNGICAYAPSDRSLCMPADAALDNQGNLWVADTWNGRVVEYQPPFAMAMPASLEVGQSSMVETGNCNGNDAIYRQPGTATNMSASAFCDPLFTTFDKDGDLWVADAGNSRVLEFVRPFSNGMAASLELGYPSAVGFTAPLPDADCTKAQSASDAAFCGPAALAFDAQGNLWVSDSQNQRVLKFSPPFSSGMAASLVIGQPDFTTRTLRPTAADTLNDPNGLTIDARGDLIVADWLNSRVLIFVPPFSNGMNASVAIGQPDMTTGVVHGCGNLTSGPPQFGYPSATTFCGPEGVLAF